MFGRYRPISGRYPADRRPLPTCYKYFFAPARLSFLGFFRTRETRAYHILRKHFENKMKRAKGKGKKQGPSTLENADSRPLTTVMTEDSQDEAQEPGSGSGFLGMEIERKIAEFYEEHPMYWDLADPN